MRFSTKKIVTFLLLGMLLITAGIAAGCSKTETQENTEPEQGAATKQLSGTLTIAGSTSVQPFSEVVAEEFMAKNPEVQVNVQGGGSSQGIEAAISGAADIGSSSRELKDEEKSQLVETRIALDGIAIVVHKDNPVGALSREQVKNIYLGNITNWKEVGGSDTAITVVSREEGSGTLDAFLSLVMDKEEITDKAIIQNSTGAVRTAVAGDKNGIGFISLAKVNEEVKALDIDGVKATVENIKSDTYKLYRTFLYVTKSEPEGLSKAFIDFVMSDEGQNLMVEEGAISIK